MDRSRRRLDRALIAAHPGLSRRKAQDAVEKGQVTVDSVTIREPGHLVDPDAEIRWDPSRRAERRARISIPLLHRDESLLVVDKPPGLLSVPTAGGAGIEDTALARVAEYVRHLTPHRPYVRAVHRLDQDTSGALTFALTPEAWEALRALFRAHRIERRYSALVTGSPAGETGTVSLPIRDAYRDGRRGVACPGEASRPAVTHWTVIERFPGAALLDVRLETGRQHQIRIHLAAIGLPVLGDRTYRSPGTGRIRVSVRRQMLHARLLAFTHPLSGKRLRVASPIPGDFERMLTLLRRMRSSTVEELPRRKETSVSRPTRRSASALQERRADRPALRRTGSRPGETIPRGGSR